MLNINRLKIEISTENGVLGIDEKFNQGLNFIASEDNTCGKSSILAAIYYCLGFEEIIGGKGEKVLTSVFKTSIEDGETVCAVLESGVYLEISNGEEIITIFRASKMENRDTRLMTVFFSTLSNIGNPNVLSEDMYVHMPNSAINKKGFHSYLERFMHLELPEVPASDDAIRKLYLQLIFSAIFIEQKHGWSDILSGMPILGIRESKKRVLEFILHMDTLDNDKQKERLRYLDNNIKSKWGNLVKESIKEANREACVINGLSFSPKIISDTDLSGISINKNNINIDEYIVSLQAQYDSLKLLKPRIIDNFEQLQEELSETENSINLIEMEFYRFRGMQSSEDVNIRSLVINLEIIETDIRNNKDSARLRDLGSNLSFSSSSDMCPVCNQSIQDTLLPNINDMPIMSIDENIRHLVAQKEMLNFSLNSHKQNISKVKVKLVELEERLFKLRRLAKSLRSDLYSTNDNLSEANIYKRLKIESEINGLIALKLYINNQNIKFIELSTEWEDYLKSKSSLPNKRFTDLDEEKLKTLRSNFIKNLKKYGYKSVLNLNEVDVSTESYLPVIEGFDMKFDSSASDNVRAIWAFTMALVQTSIDKGGNHPNILIFDEPAQHSIITNDMEEFFKSIIDFGGNCQVLVGITIKDIDIRQTIERLKPETYNLIKVKNKAFRKFNSKIE